MDAILQGPWNRAIAAVAESDLVALMDSGGDTLAEHLVAAALDRQADDNVTAVAVEVAPGVPDDASSAGHRGEQAT